jgi:hypothetical protein
VIETENFDKKELTRLMRSIAREVAYEVIDEHLEDYEHTARKPDQTELEGEA